ncbi:MAG: hypothetical protein IJS08_05610, partial [Victivallales bacterium]|nr:hypothetical protein [Victivallales bacterium]
MCSGSPARDALATSSPARDALATSICAYFTSIVFVATLPDARQRIVNVALPVGILTATVS